MSITPITKTDDLVKLVESLKSSQYITIDTEFLRTTTYFAKLCLIQVANDDGAHIIDPLAEGLDLSSFYELMDGGPIKVFHASRQDLEIFFHAMGKVPSPIFDTQVAAMVCGYGDSAGYETLVKSIAKESIDKSIRFTDWSIRPLTDKQLNYALSDVTHLRVIYKHLAESLEKSGRTSWLVDEFSILTSENTYKIAPEKSWKRIKCKSNNRRFLGYVQAMAAFREVEAVERDVPRNRIMRDDLLLSIAAHPPSEKHKVGKIKGLSKRYSNGEAGDKFFAALQAVVNTPESDLPEATPKRFNGNDRAGPSLELLKVLLKLKCTENDVASKLVASSKDLEQLATSNNTDMMCMQGWRYDVFGKDAERLMNGELAMVVNGKTIELKEVS